MKNVIQGLIVCFALIVSQNNFAQTNADLNIGVVPVFSAGSESLIFVDANIGEIKSFAILDEPIWSVNLNEEENIFFAQSRHHIYKGSLKTGEVLDEYQYMEVLKEQKDDDMDPNINIIPYGVTKN